MIPTIGLRKYEHSVNVLFLSYNFTLYQHSRSLPKMLFCTIM